MDQTGNHTERAAQYGIFLKPGQTLKDLDESERSMLEDLTTALRRWRCFHPDFEPWDRDLQPHRWQTDLALAREFVLEQLQAPTLGSTWLRDSIIAREEQKFWEAVQGLFPPAPAPQEAGPLGDIYEMLNVPLWPTRAISLRPAAARLLRWGSWPELVFLAPDHFAAAIQAAVQRGQHEGKLRLSWVVTGNLEELPEPVSYGYRKRTHIMHWRVGVQPAASRLWRKLPSLLEELRLSEVIRQAFLALPRWMAATAALQERGA